MLDPDGLVLVARVFRQSGIDGEASATVMVEVVRQRDRLLPVLAQALVAGLLVGSIIVNIVQADELARLRKQRDSLPVVDELTVGDGWRFTIAK